MSQNNNVNNGQATPDVDLLSDLNAAVAPQTPNTTSAVPASLNATLGNQNLPSVEINLNSRIAPNKPILERISGYVREKVGIAVAYSGVTEKFNRMNQANSISSLVWNSAKSFFWCHIILWLG